MKKEISEKINYQLNWAWGVELSEMETDIENIKLLGANYVEIKSEHDSISVVAFNRRLETDKECKTRIAKESKQKADKEYKERLEYERLKAKFEGTK